MRGGCVSSDFLIGGLTILAGGYVFTIGFGVVGASGGSSPVSLSVCLVVGWKLEGRGARSGSE